jgi:aminocarboxymuconate-semialdehyde decarboxylase
VIDFHAHFVPRSALDAIASAGSPPSYDPETRTVAFASGSSRPISSGLVDLDLRIGAIDENRIDVQVLSPWTELIGDDLRRTEAIRWTSLLNDCAAEAVGANPQFRLLAALPPAGGDAARELERCVEKLRFVGGALPTQYAGVDLDDSHLEDLFSAAASLDVPLFIHPGRVLDPARLSQYFLSNICGYPFETTLAAFRLFFSGTFDRHPSLNLVLAHGGGALPMLAGRAAHTMGRVPGVPGSSSTPSTPSEILGRFYYDTVVHDPMALAFTMSRVGHDRMVVGTDMPFPMAIAQPRDLLREAATVWAHEPSGDAPMSRFDLTARRLLGL